MNRTNRTIVVVGIAVAIAGFASFGVLRAIQQMPVREVEVRSLYQVVASHDLAMGSMITSDDVKLVAWPASSPVTGGFTAVESVLNRGLIAAVVANEPLTESKLASLEVGDEETLVPERQRRIEREDREVDVAVGSSRSTGPRSEEDRQLQGRTIEEDLADPVVVFRHSTSL